MPPSKSSKPHTIRPKQEDSPLSDELALFLTGRIGSNTPAPVAFFIAGVIETLAQLRDYGIKEYGHQWFHEEDPQFAAAFGIKKFAERLYKTIVTKRLPMPEAEKLKSNAIDAATYALFLVALIEAGKVSGVPSEKTGK